MNIAQTIINSLSISLCVGTAISLLLHETNADRAAIAALTTRDSRIESVVSQPGNKPHTHTERGSLHQAIRDLNASQPRIQPRTNEDREYDHSSPDGKGRHPFDNHTLPIVG